MIDEMTTRFVSVTREALLPFMGYVSNKEIGLIAKPGVFTLGAVTDFGQGEMGSGILMFTVNDGTAEIIYASSYRLDRQILSDLVSEFARICIESSVKMASIAVSDEKVADLTSEFLGRHFLGYSKGSAVKFYIKNDMTPVDNKRQKVILFDDIPKQFMNNRTFANEIALLSELNKSEKKEFFGFLSDNNHLLSPFEADDAIMLCNTELSYVWIGDKGIEGALLLRTFMDDLYPFFYVAKDENIGKALIAEAFARVTDLMPKRDIRVICEKSFGKLILQ